MGSGRELPRRQSKVPVSARAQESAGVQDSRLDTPRMLSIKHTEICISMSSHVVARNKLLGLLLIQWFLFHGKEKRA